MRSRRIAVVVGAVVVAVLTVTLAVLMWTGRTAGARESARESALAEAPALVAAVLSHNSVTVDDDLAAAAAVTTGPFADEFRDYVTETVAPQSKSDGTSTRARVVDIGYLDGTADRATLLAFVDQITTSTLAPAPASASSRVEVDLALVDGHWRVAGLTVI